MIEKNKIISLFDQGYSVRKISDKVKHAPSTIQKLKREYEETKAKILKPKINIELDFSDEAKRALIWVLESLDYDLEQLINDMKDFIKIYKSDMDKRKIKTITNYVENLIIIINNIQKEVKEKESDIEFYGNKIEELTKLLNDEREEKSKIIQDRDKLKKELENKKKIEK